MYDNFSTDAVPGPKAARIVTVSILVTRSAHLPFIYLASVRQQAVVTVCSAIMAPDVRWRLRIFLSSVALLVVVVLFGKFEMSANCHECPRDEVVLACSISSVVDEVVLSSVVSSYILLYLLSSWILLYLLLYLPVSRCILCCIPLYLVYLLLQPVLSSLVIFCCR